MALDFELPGPTFTKCCFCIPLNIGALILGILVCISSAFAVADIFIVLGDFSFNNLAILVLCGCNIICAVAFVMLCCSNTKESRKRFASWWAVSMALGLIAFCVLMILAGHILTNIISTAIGLLISYYLYLCLKSYANETFSESLLSVK